MGKKGLSLRQKPLGEQRKTQGYLCSSLIEALGQGDSQALPTLFSMARLVSNAEMASWGRAYQDVVETKDHMGVKQSGFGYVLPCGRGASGYVAISGNPVVVDDYLNSPYRYPSVTPTGETNLPIKRHSRSCCVTSNGATINGLIDP